MEDNKCSTVGPDNTVKHEPIAIIGMSCRLAPQLSSLEHYWEFLVQERCAVREIPNGRWDDYESSSPQVAATLRKATRLGCFMEHIDRFDPEFFGISPREAESLDPQQRMILELTWEALEHSGIRPSTIRGSETGVFAAGNSFDYGHRMFSDLCHIEPWALNGGMLFGIANRVSYLFDLHGPSLVVDTACAGSLTAVHLACQSLLDQSTPLAVVAGINLMSFPGMTLALDAMGATAADGHCKSFDNAANGYGRGEGAGVLILKRYSDAVRDQDRVLALIRGSGVFQDGRTAGMMAPNGEAQELMLRQVYRQAGIACESVQYVEAHGTGTRLGDKAELTAIARVFGAGRRPENRCLVGSVKPNIGHLEAGAGMAGLIKTVLALDHGQIPRSLYDTLTGEIEWEDSGLQIVSRLQDWPVSQGPRRAGVSCFGVGGTIAHVIVEAPPTASQASSTAVCPGDLLFPLSGHSQESLKHNAARLADWLQAHPEVALEDVGYSLSRRRDHLQHRGTVVAATRPELIETLRAAAQGSDSERWYPGPGNQAEGLGPVFVFSGHGAQWNGMCRELLESEPIFAAELDALAAIFIDELGYSPRQALEQGDFSSIERTQAMTFAIQVALAALWRSKGVEPQAVIGYSIGEIAASVVAGALDKQSAARFACRRAAIYQRLSGQGAMLLVDLPFAQAKERLAASVKVVAAIAASPSSTVISGDAMEVERIAGEWAEAGIVPRRVATDVAFHSPHIDRVVADIRQAASELRCQPPRLPMYNSTLLDSRAEAVRDAAFWAANSRDPVLFEQAVTAALEDGYTRFLEVSSKPIVSHSLRETADLRGDEEVLICPTLREGRAERREILGSLARLHGQGTSVAWERQYPQGVLLDVPGMGWNHRRYWTRAQPVRSSIGKGHDALQHSLLGSHERIHSAPVSDVWRTRLDFDSRPYPGSHPICDVEILPAAVLLNTFMQAGVVNACLPSLNNVVLRTPVAVEGSRDVQIVRQGKEIRLSSRLDDGSAPTQQERELDWVTHTTATLERAEQRHGIAPGYREWLAQCPEHLDWATVEPLYRNRGIGGYGFSWSIRTMHRGAGKIVALIEAGASHDQPASWAVALDAALTVIPLLLPDDAVLRMPAAIARICARHDAPQGFTLFADLVHQESVTEGHITNLVIVDEQGDVAARIEGLVFMTVDRQEELASLNEPTVFIEEWEPCLLPRREVAAPQLVLIGDHNSLSCRVSAGLDRAAIAHRLVQDLDEIVLDEQATILVVLGMPPRDGEDLATSVERNVWRLLHSAQVAARQADRLPALGMACVTFGVRAMDERATLGQSALWGASRIVAGEHPELWSGLIDIDPEALDLDSTFSHLLDALGRGAEDVIAIEADAVAVLRLKEAPVQKASLEQAMQCSADATYAITGGLGALGLEAAQHLVNLGARRLLLIGRQALPAREHWPLVQAPSLRSAIDRVQTLELQGVTVMSLALDIADEEAVAQALSGSALGLPPIRGIVHAAGVFNGQMIQQLERKVLQETLKAKVQGTLVLEKLFPPGSLEFLVLFSSSGQLARLSGQAAYAAANGFMDGFAKYRGQIDGHRTLSLAWMAWDRLGMSRNIAATLQEARANGLDLLSVANALAAWQAASASQAPYVAVFRLHRGQESGPSLPLLSNLLDIQENSAAQQITIDPWAQVPSEQLTQWLIDDIQALIAAELRCAPTDISPRRSLVEKGMDSLITVALRIRLKKRYRIDIPPTLIWNHPTVQAIAHYVRGQLG